MARQILTESLLLALAGGFFGSLFALWGRQILVTLLSANAGRVAVQLSSSWQVLATSTLISCIAGLLFGIIPALRLPKGEGAQYVRPAAPRMLAGKVLVVVQVAISVPLLVGALLFLRTFSNLGRVELGFNPSGLVLFRMDPTLNGYDREGISRLYDSVRVRLEEIPGVMSATLIENALVSGWISNTQISVDGAEPASIHMNRIGPRFCETMGLTLLSGRGIEVIDHERAPPVAVINEAAARKFFGPGPALGRYFTQSAGGEKREVEVVGVVRDSKYESLRNEVPPTMFLPHRQAWHGPMHAVVRSTNMAGIAEKLRAAVASVDAEVPITDMRTQIEQIESTLGRERVFTTLLIFFGGFAVLLACIGLHGVTAFAVRRRTSEIGIRIAVGARRFDVLWLILRQVLLLAGIGLAVGVPGSFAATRIVRAMLFGVEPNDPFSVGAAAALLISVAAISGFLPAYSASRLDPLMALRHE